MRALPAPGSRRALSDGTNAQRASRSERLRRERWLRQCRKPAPNAGTPEGRARGAAPRERGALHVSSVDHPPHYNAHPSGIECIDIIEWLPFNLGCALKYVWRAGLKGDSAEDLQKARWYLERAVKSGIMEYSVPDRTVYLAKLVADVEDKESGITGGGSIPDRIQERIAKRTLLARLLTMLVQKKVNYVDVDSAACALRESRERQIHIVKDDGTAMCGNAGGFFFGGTCDPDTATCIDCKRLFKLVTEQK